jgi:hypothetical protein
LCPSTLLRRRLGFLGLGRSSLVLYFVGITNDTTYLWAMAQVVCQALAA